MHDIYNDTNNYNIPRENGFLQIGIQRKKMCEKAFNYRKIGCKYKKK